MKVSKAQANENRDAIVRAAAEQIRTKGFDQMSVADVAQAAGLTHGALYSHFRSKETLKEAATRQTFDDTVTAFSGLAAEDLLERYLSTGHCDHPGQGCPNAALVSEVWRQAPSTQEAFRDGIARFIALTSDSLKIAGAAADHDTAVTMLATMVGALALSRAIRQVDEAAANDILRAVLTRLENQIAGASQG